MNAADIWRLGENSPAAMSLIPINFTQTAPRMSFQGVWIAEFWYFTVSDERQSLAAPRFYLALELPAGHAVAFRRLCDQSVYLGPAPELETAWYYEKQNRYLQRCAELTESDHPAQAAVQELQRLWLETLPAVMRPRLADEEMEVAAIEGSGEAKPAPTDYVSFWKIKLGEALQSGDRAKIEEANTALKKGGR